MPPSALTPARPPSTPAPPHSRRSVLARLAGLASGSLLLGGVRNAFAAPAEAQAYPPYIGEILIVGFNFAPVGWLKCDGQLLQIIQYETLFALIGTSYGGDGQTTFALPDLRGRIPLHSGPQYALAQTGGEANSILATNELPGHAHTPLADGAVGTSASPAGRLPARDPAGVPTFGAGASLASMGAGNLAASGGTQPHNNLPPYVALNFIIAYEGIFPSPA